jgi:hypothetical protein
MPKSAPAILIVPADCDVARLDLAPPLLKFFARDVEGRRRNQVIEDYRVLLAPAERGDGAQIIIVEQVAR